MLCIRVPSSLLTATRCGMLALAALSGLMLAGPAEAAPADDAFQFAQGLYNQGRWKSAAETFEKFLKDYPQDQRVPIALLYQGICLAKDEQHQPARQRFADYIQRYPQGGYLPDARYRLARSSFLLEDYKNAITQFEAFLDKHPKHEYRQWALADYGVSLLRTGDPAKAQTVFQTSLNEFPKGPQAEDSQYGLGKSLENQQKFAEAVAAYNLILTNPASRQAAQAMLNIGDIYYKQKDYPKAAETFTGFSARFPQHAKIPTANLNAGFAWYQAKQYEKAIKAFELVLPDPELGVTAGFWLGLSYQSANEYKNAIQTYAAVSPTAAGHELEERVHANWALCLLKDRQYKESREKFLDNLKRWPKGQTADESLLQAAEASLLEGDLPVTRELLLRFEKDFPNSPLKYHHELQKGRYFIEVANQLTVKEGDPRPTEAEIKKNYTLAKSYFEGVIKLSQIPATKLTAQLHLIEVQQHLNEHQAALDAVKQLAADPQADYHAHALLLQARSHLALTKYADASQSARASLTAEPHGLHAEDASILVALAEMKQGNAEAAHTALKALIQTFPESPKIAHTTYQLAEIAYDDKNWNYATTLYQALIDLGKENPYHAAGLSGLAWTQFQQLLFKEAAQTFQRVVEEHPQNLNYAPEAAYQMGDALARAEDLPAASKTFEATFTRLAPEKPASVGDEYKGVWKYAYLAGLQWARTLSLQGKVPESAAAYQQVVAKYPQCANLDKLLDEWALLHYAAGEFDKSDAIWQRLIKDCPNSPKVFEARLNLAESALMRNELPAARQEFEALYGTKAAGPEVKEVSLLHLVGIYAEQGDWKQTESAGTQFLKDFPQSPQFWDVRFKLAEALVRQSKTEPALEHLKALKAALMQNMQQPPEWQGDVFVLLGEAWFQMKDYNQVEALYGEFKTLAPASEQMYLMDELLGRAHKQRGDFVKAREAFQRTLQDEKHNRTEAAAKAQFMIADTLMAEKNYKDAKPEYLKVYTLFKFPQWQSAALFQVAGCEEHLGEWRDAVKTYQTLLTEFPASEFAEQAQDRMAKAQEQAARQPQLLPPEAVTP